MFLCKILLYRKLLSSISCASNVHDTIMTVAVAAH